MSYKRISPQPVSEGGTGASTLTGVLTGNGTSAVTASAVTQYGVLVGGASNAVSSTAVGTSGQVLTSNGAGNAPTFQTASSNIGTLDGNSGSATGSTVTIETSANDLGTFNFSGSGSTLTLNFVVGTDNCVVGTSVAQTAWTGSSYNTGMGVATYANLSGGTNNVAIGFGSLNTNTSGSYNTACGYYAGQQATGSYNIALGYDAGANWDAAESSNIAINNAGSGSENNTLRIGEGTGTGNQDLNRAYICGIQTIVVTGTAVLVSSSNQLGVAASSSRYKNDIQDMGDASSPVLNLRPVTFVWNKQSSDGLKNATDNRQFGLIAEEVAQVMPTLVAYDKDDKPFSVNYQDLPAMLLNELQKALKRIDALEKKLGI